MTAMRSLTAAVILLLVLATSTWTTQRASAQCCRICPNLFYAKRPVEKVAKVPSSAENGDDAADDGQPASFMEEVARLSRAVRMRRRVAGSARRCCSVCASPYIADHTYPGILSPTTDESEHPAPPESSEEASEAAENAAEWRQVEEDEQAGPPVNARGQVRETKVERGYKHPRKRRKKKDRFAHGSLLQVVAHSIHQSVMGGYTVHGGESALLQVAEPQVHVDPNSPHVTGVPQVTSSLAPCCKLCPVDCPLRPEDQAAREGVIRQPAPASLVEVSHTVRRRNRHTQTTTDATAARAAASLDPVAAAAQETEQDIGHRAAADQQSTALSIAERDTDAEKSGVLPPDPQVPGVDPQDVFGDNQVTFDTALAKDVRFRRRRFFDKVKKVAHKVVHTVKKVVHHVKRVVKKVVHHVKRAVKHVVHHVGRIIRHVASAVKNVVMKIGSVFRKISAAVRKAINKTVNFLKSDKSGLFGKVFAFFKRAKEHIVNIAQRVRKHFAKAAEFVRGFIRRVKPIRVVIGSQIHVYHDNTHPPKNTYPPGILEPDHRCDTQQPGCCEICLEQWSDKKVENFVGEVVKQSVNDEIRATKPAKLPTASL
eukprot:TRINITY_DN66412_c9_g9_i1.p1 TRINITY_DN66412_c9_g9~~TRINITY_DN66412_c9_g9_i1.p1  ORF type:complete len:607 (-),score=276.95 TRINITY_DN66412_c9_g9_i1:129-1919(-)